MLYSSLSVCSRCVRNSMLIFTVFASEREFGVVKNVIKGGSWYKMGKNSNAGS